MQLTSLVVTRSSCMRHIVLFVENTYDILSIFGEKNHLPQDNKGCALWGQ